MRKAILMMLLAVVSGGVGEYAGARSIGRADSQGKATGG